MFTKVHNMNLSLTCYFSDYIRIIIIINKATMVSRQRFVAEQGTTCINMPHRGSRWINFKSSNVMTDRNKALIFVLVLANTPILLSVSMLVPKGVIGFDNIKNLRTAMTFIKHKIMEKFNDNLPLRVRLILVTYRTYEVTQSYTNTC